MNARSLLPVLLVASAALAPSVVGGQEPDRLTELVRRAADELRTGPEREGASRAYSRLRSYGPRLGLDLPPFRPEEPLEDLEPQIDSLVAAGRPEEAVALADTADEEGGVGSWAHLAVFRVQDRFGTRRALDIAFRYMRRPARVVYSIVSRSGDSSRPWNPAVLEQIAAAPLDEETREAARIRAMGAMAEADPETGWRAAQGAELEARSELAIRVLLGLTRAESRPLFADSAAQTVIDALPDLPPRIRSAFRGSVIASCLALELEACDRAGLFDTLNPASFARYGTRCESAEGFWDAVIEQNRRMDSAGAPPGRAAAFRAMALAQGGVTFWGATCDPRMDSVFTAWMPELDALEPSLSAEDGEDVRVHLARAWASRDPGRARGPASRIVDDQRRNSALTEVVRRAWDFAPLHVLDVWSELVTGSAPLPGTDPDGYELYRQLGRDDDAEALLSKLTESARFEARMGWARVLLGARRHDDAGRLALRAIAEWTPTPEPPSLQRPWDTLEQLGLLESLMDRVAAVDDPVTRGATLAEMVAVRLNRR